jgi:perosamine synthetase
MTGESKSELKELFDKVVSLVQSSPSDEHLSDDIKLQLYGLYKRCTVGRAADSDSSEPSLWNIVAYRKYGAWKKVDNLDLEQAMQRYIRVVSMLDNSTGAQCRDLFKEESLSEMVASESVGERPHDNGATPPEHGKDNIEKKCTLDQPAKILTVGPVKPCMFQRLTGIQPFVPRGELDITFTDIAYALFRCIKLPSPFFEAPMRATLRLEDEIAQTWNSNTTMNLEVIPGLSVRSLVDLYLSAKSYPKGSELIIVPPIGIEGMMDVIQYHGLNIIPVDIGDYSDDPVLHVDIDKVKQAMNEKTVAVLVVHAFGLICVNEEEMKELRNVVDNHSSAKDVEIWEDCAECFEGQGGYMGSEYANVHFFSFGTIKTCTALGGGICALNSQLDKGAKATVEHMKRIQHMMNGQQTGKEYFVKIVKASVLLLFGKNPMLMGVVIWILDILGINYDNIVTSAVKGFPCVPPKAGSSEFDLNEHKRIRAIQLVQRLRKCPHPALLSLLHRRLRSKRTSITVMKRMERSAKMKQLFKEYLPASIQIPTGGQGSKHLFWLFPIITSDADKVYQKMKRYGFDIPRGTSQLGCVTKYLLNSEKHLDSCPNTLRMMSEISYLPVASRDMSETEMRKLVSYFYKDHQYIDDIDKKDSLSAMLPFTTLGMLMATLIIFDLYHFQVVFSLTLIATYIARTWQLFVGVFAVIFAVAVCLRTFLATEYINSSKTFARYNSILSSSPKKQNDLIEIMTRKSGASIVDGSDIHAQTYDLENHSALMLPQEYDHGECNDKQVLLAGATGFIGSLLLRDLLMHRSQTSIKGGVVIICRSKRGQSAKQRMQSLLSKEMFSFLSEDQKEKLVTVIEGDLSLPKIGLSEPEYNSLCDELNVTHVINCAACINFMEPLAKAAESNITSALQLQLLSKSMKRNKVNYIYISTAFVHGGKTGSVASPLPQKLFDLQKYDPLDLYESMMNTESCASAAMNDLGFPNTYTFTKSICEHLLMRDQSIRTTIIRPCIVGPAVQNPCEGWAGDKPSTMTSTACLYLSNPVNIWSFKRVRTAVIPVDVVSRFILAKAFETHAEDLTTATSDENHSGLSSFDSSTSGQESDLSSEQSYVFAKSSASERRNVKPKDHNRSNECVQGPTGQSRIYNATWDASSPESTTFQLYNFACATVQLGSAKNHAGKFTTYLVFLVSCKIFLAMDLTFKQFRKVHRNLVHLPLSCLQRVCKRFGLRPRSLRNLEKLMPLIDLPVLFFPFSSSTFHFESDLVAPVTFNGERYMFSCILAAEQFILSPRQRKQSQQGAHKENEEIVMKSDRMVIAGKNCPSPYSDLLWCMMQPRGNIVIRFVGWIVIKLLRAVTSEVTLDTGSFSSITRAVTEIQHSVRNQEESLQNKTFIILAPTHRSFLDFIILSFIAFQVPELGIPIPSIAAADEFSRIPIIGLMTRLAGAFFLERGKGVADPALQAKVHSLKLKHSENNPTCIEVFLEGSRSRDRRFVKPKTGFLR